MQSVPDLGQILQDPAAMRGVGYSGCMEVLLRDPPADMGSNTSSAKLVRSCCVGYSKTISDRWTGKKMLLK